jgi:L-asparaginase / beta-aspartyl-peptidase
MPFAIIVHGGAGTIAHDRLELAQEGCKEAAVVGWQVLQAGGTALDAVEAAVRALEDNPNFNAGTGSTLTAAGTVEMDAGIMDGHRLNVGAVASVECIKNPISLARKVLESPHVLLVGRGAQQFASEQGISLCAAEDLITGRQLDNWKAARAAKATEAGQQGENDEPRYVRHVIGSVSADQQTKGAQAKAPGKEEKHGTVGAAALDMYGHLAAATSTGGIHNKYPGRVGDSPIVGCGFYADEYAAVSCTGHGEDFIRLMIAKRAADFVGRGVSPQAAAEAAIAVLSAKAEGTGGLILVDRLGNVGYGWNSEHLARAYMVDGMDEPVAGI